MNAPVFTFEGFLKGRFSILLTVLILMFLVVPLIPGDQTAVDRAFGILNLVVLISCLRAIAVSRRFFIFMLVLSIVNFGIGSAELFSKFDSHTFETAVLVFKLTYLFLIFISIIKYVMDSSPVTHDKIFGAISAYFLLGIIWAYVFALFYHFDSACFVIPAEMLSSEEVNRFWALYYSFTTLTTLGYGDILPRTNAAQSYAFMEAACGQIFLTVLIARLVALQIIHSSQDDQ